MIPTSQLTGTALATEALEELGASTAGDTLDSTDGAKALSALNRLIDTTNITRGNIVTEQVDTWTMTIGQQDYTIGQDPNGVLTPDFDAQRPVRVTRANLLMTTGSSTIRRKITLLTKKQWERKVLQNAPGMPIEMYNDGDFPLSTYHFDMTPDQAYDFETYSWKQFSPLATLATKIAIPPGYYEFWLYSLVMRLAGPFRKQPSATTIQLWKDARAAVQIHNAGAIRNRLNTDLESNEQGLYNWMSGEMEID